MIHLDTNFLILASAPGSAQDTQLQSWLAAGKAIAIDATLTDCMIAAIALRAGAALATSNVADFKPFEAHGLKIIPI